MKIGIRENSIKACFFNQNYAQYDSIQLQKIYSFYQRDLLILNIIKMQNQYAYLMCAKHPNHRVASINFDENNVDDSRLQCSSCLIDLLNKNQKKNYSLVDIDEFLKNPIIQVQRVMKYDGFKSFCDVDYFQQFEKEINIIEDKFKQTIIELRVCVKEIQNLKDKFQQEFQALSKLNSLIEQYDKAIWEQDDQLKKLQIKSFEERVDFISKNLNSAKLQANQNLIRSQEMLTNMFKNQLQTLIQDINRFQKVSMATFYLNNIQGLPITIYEELKNFPLIHYKISDGIATQYQLLYQGSKDGLALKQYYSKCLSQSNLLTIITTNNGSKFGGYSPCPLQNDQVDPLLKSFLFQYNKQEIYKIKDQNKNVYNGRKLSCQFGDGDIVFDDSFTKFSSNLGISYDISNYDIQDRRSHILGELNPQIIEFKVYKVIFSE
ncbi:hypothetical protein pb186bvf_003149 [Paramecium bursaria]